MLPVLQIGGLAIQTPGLVLLVAAWVVLWLAAREAERLGLDGDAVYNAGFIALVVSIVSARLVYIAQHLPTYLANPADLISLDLASFAPLPGALIGLLAGATFAARRRLRWAALTDAFAPALAAGLALWSVAALLGGTSYGQPADLPWAITLWGARRHPTQIYELLAALVILAVLLRARTRRAYAGQTFLLFLALYGGARLFLEAFRADSWLLAGGLRAAQVLGLVAAITALAIMARRAGETATPEPVAQAENGEGDWHAPIQQV
jgi:phosphatidylglycerol:prolipoprotein diacylglycerol transferase